METPVKTSFKSMALIGAALASTMVCYTISLRVSAERAGVEAVRGQTARDLRDIRLLQAELRTRSRLPELQRWNEQVLALAPPKAEQFLGGTVSLASFAAAAPAAPAVQHAVERAAVAAPSPVRQVAYVAPERPAPRTPAPRAEPGLAGLADTIAAAAVEERAGFRQVALR